MKIALIQSEINDVEVGQFIKEFPQYLFLAPNELSFSELGKAEWEKVEIFCGTRLTETQLEMATSLRWIHCPQINMNAICLKAVEKKANIIVTRTKEENSSQVAEFVIGGVLAFAKSLFSFKENKAKESASSISTLKNKRFLQIGLDANGEEIARFAQFFGMEVFGVKEKPSFHPFCKKVFSLDDLPELLSKSDLVSVSFGQSKRQSALLTSDHFDQMRQDSIFIVTQSKNIFDEEDLLTAVSSGKLKGVLLDQHVAEDSTLWDFSNVLITPSVASLPLNQINYLAQFRHNLRQYLHNNYHDMIHRLERVGAP